MTKDINYSRRGREREIDTSYNVPEMVGLYEVAQLVNKPKSVVLDRMLRGKFPEPAQHLSSGPLWVKEEIEQFIKTPAWEP